MVGEGTSKTEVVPAFTMYCGYDFAKIFVLDTAFDGVFAVGRGAPL
jgi:hypothetical protein